MKNPKTNVTPLRAPKGGPELQVHAGGNVTQPDLMAWADTYARAVLRIHGAPALPAETPQVAA